jgi:hypothetical protein
MEGILLSLSMKGVVINCQWKWLLLATQSFKSPAATALLSGLGSQCCLHSYIGQQVRRQTVPVL